MKTPEQIDSEINALMTEKQQIENNKLDEVIFDLFVEMSKEEVLAKIRQMMELSPLLKSEVKRLLIDNQ